jgi:PAS domain S-box-containing protein
MERYMSVVSGTRPTRESAEAVRRQALLLELTPVLMRDPEDRIIFWNRAAEILYGFTGDQALGRLSHELLQTKYPVPLAQIMTRLHAGMPWEGELQITRSDGTRITVASEWIAYLDDRGVLEAVIEVNTEVTARKQAEEARDRLAAIIDSSEDAIISKDLDGNITSWNASAERLYGYRAEEVIGQSIFLLVPPESQAEEVRVLARLRQGERIDHYETERVRKDGHRVPVSLTISPIKDSTGAIIGASKIARDITERRRTEAELQAARAALADYATRLESAVAERTAELRNTVTELEAFSYTVSHDLRAPLRAISAFTSLLMEDHGAEMAPDALELLNRVENAAARMDRLLKDLAAFSRVSRQPIELGPVDVDKLVREIVVRPELQLAGARVHIEDSLLPMWGHEPSMNHCVINLISNAVKFVAPGVNPEIRIRSESVNNNHVRLSVQDNGIGIDPAAHAKVFDLFHRLSNEYEGTGMGLAIVKRAAERMGGRVGLDSAPGKGSQFWIELRAA